MQLRRLPARATFQALRGLQARKMTKPPLVATPQGASSRMIEILLCVILRTAYLRLNASTTSAITTMTISIGTDSDAIIEIGLTSGTSIINHHVVIRKIPLPPGKNSA